MTSTAVFLGIACASATTAPTNSSPTVAPLILSGRQSARPAGTYSAGVAELIKMLDAKVETEVMLAYIQGSPIAYNPDATELIGLKEHGASTEMLTTVLHHGDELRLRLAQAESAVNPAPAASAYAYAPEPAYPATAVAPYADSGEAAYPAVYSGYAYGRSWLFGAPLGNRHRPFLNEQARWNSRCGEPQFFANSGRQQWGNSAPGVGAAARAVLAANRAHALAPPWPAGNVQGSGGRVGGRAR
ncbi:MAG TPA: hypothetical protein VNZ64_06720 [Candidatus Acidoferrum sp.]|nr:hypothetical protein [Candidatus Acidoferrum sp.]